MLSLHQPSTGSGLMSNVTLGPRSPDQLLNSLLSAGEQIDERIFLAKTVKYR